MPDTQYRLFFDNSPAAQQQLDMIAEIVVEQEVDMAWEARFKIPISADEQGNWIGEDDNILQPFTRARVEVRIGTEPYVPLFDGAIMEFESQMSSQPGQSTLTLIAQDDSFFMNRIEQVVAFENLLDHEVVEQIYSDYGDLVAATQVDNTPASGSALPPLVVQRGTAMDILRFLARRQGMHAYVLPGENPGDSIGCFKPFATSPNGLPPLILLGAERNIDALQVRYHAGKPSDAAASTLRITDKQVVDEMSRSSDVELMGDETAEDSSQAALQLLLPRQGESVDLRQAADAVVNAASYAYEASGSVLPETYTAVLQPYQVVTVKAGNTTFSGDYLIMKSTHTITRSGYSQSFTLTRNARSARYAGGQSSVPGGIF